MENHKDFTRAPASNTAIQASRIQRFGYQYYPVDETYDKRVYENTTGNWIIICLALLVFWFFQALHWWGVFEFGISDSTNLMWYSIAIFCYTVIFGMFLIISGSFANFKKRKHEFLKERLAIMTAELEEKANKAQQEKEYNERLREQEQAARKAAAESAAAPQTTTAGGKQVVTNIQDAAPAAVSPDQVKLITTK